MASLDRATPARLQPCCEAQDGTPMCSYRDHHGPFAAISDYLTLVPGYAGGLAQRCHVSSPFRDCKLLSDIL